MHEESKEADHEEIKVAVEDLPISVNIQDKDPSDDSEDKEERKLISDDDD